MGIHNDEHSSWPRTQRMNVNTAQMEELIMESCLVSIQGS